MPFTDYIKTADIGNVDMLSYDYDYTFKNVDKVMTSILDNKKFPITLGGDHSITYRAIKSVINHNPGKRIGLIWLDNHLDTMEDYHGDIYHCGIVNCGILCQNSLIKLKQKMLSIWDLEVFNLERKDGKTKKN